MAPPWHLVTEAALVRKVTVGPYENNAYLVACARTAEAVLIDAASEPDRLVGACHDADVKAIITTHGHFDHIGAARQTADALGAPFMLHPEDAEVAGIAFDEPIAPGTMRIGRLDLDIRHTPGHTPGSVCVVVDGAVFTGDTLFPGGPGATRFPYSSFEGIIASVSDCLFTLDDVTIVMPGHGLDTTIGTERPHLASWIARGW